MMMKKLVVAITALALAGCSAVQVKKPVADMTEKLKKGPGTAPYRTITNFSDQLGCMDTLFLSYGVRDVSVLVEDLADATKKVNAGTRDMLISAVSDMTKQSHAIRLVTFGPDASNLANFLAQAKQEGSYSRIPTYDIRGSISQLDENIAKKQIDGGLGIGPVNLGLAATSGTNILGLDLNVITTRDFSLVPGVNARNSVVIYKDGYGVDGGAEYKKFGINYGMTISKAEGTSQALRNLVELASIELFGKLTKVPYWTCLGADANNASAQKEISDWYAAMAVNGQIVAYTQQQLAWRGYYQGEADGKSSPELAQAVAQYREVLGLSREPELDLAFFKAYLFAKHHELAFTSPPPFERRHIAVSDPASPAAPSPAKASPGELQVIVASSNQAKSFKPGELLNLIAASNRDAHIYCYLQDEAQKIQRFFPNRFRPDSLVKYETGVNLPGDMGFQLYANEKKVNETVACFATEQDVLKALPAEVVGNDFEDLPLTSLDQVKQAFAAANGKPPAESVLVIGFGQ